MDINNLLVQCDEMLKHFRKEVRHIIKTNNINGLYEHFIYYCKNYDNTLLIIFNHIYNINKFFCYCYQLYDKDRLISKINTKQQFFYNMIIHDADIRCNNGVVRVNEINEALKNDYLRNILKELINRNQFYSYKKNYKYKFIIKVFFEDGDVLYYKNNIKL